MITISAVHTAVLTPEGDGANVYRVVGSNFLRNYDPFLLLDEFHVKPPAGFPHHPHRGFETVTYMLEGAFTHKDFCGHEGTIHPGDLQWMTAGKGIVHSEMPATKQVNKGLQLWINLKARDKMIDPAYQELLDKDIPRKTEHGVEVKVIAGSSMGIDSPVYTRTPTMYLDVRMEKDSSFLQAVPSTFNAFVYVLEGEAMFGETETIGKVHQMLLMSKGDHIRISTASQSCRFVMIGGEPLNEPIVQHGPFVMNTREGIMQTFQDYQERKNGFESLNTAEW